MRKGLPVLTVSTIMGAFERARLHPRGSAGGLVVMATMAVMSWRGIDALTHSREVAQQRLAQTERLQTVLAQWETDLRALQDSRRGAATVL